MLGLFDRRRPPRAAAPAGTVVYAIGDIHGCLDLLMRLQEEILTDMRRRSADRRVAVYLGDFVDRGPDSRGVLDRLIDMPLPDCESVHLAGNHDRWLARFLTDVSVAPPWLRHGGVETLQSYGVAPPRALDRDSLLVAQAALAVAMPAAHRTFLDRLPASHMEGDYFFAHAGVRPGVPLAEQTEHDLIWIREEFLMSNTDFGKVVVHGHTPSPTPERHANRIAVDTGAFMTGRLTAAVLEGNGVAFLHGGASLV
jgi:serine/threonine protein phosphatase 1